MRHDIAANSFHLRAGKHGSGSSHVCNHHLRSHNPPDYPCRRLPVGSRIIVSMPMNARAIASGELSITETAAGQSCISH